ncbi:hypothetical protein IL306_001009 [Fusarium sp. DS 682]|nr:hypothetical protein IL306_001009 [Fusarium sp. DS 682]
MQENVDYISQMIDLVENIVLLVERSYLAKCAIRILTMRFLEIRHLRICFRGNIKLHTWFLDPTYEEDCAEIQDEDSPLVEQLDALVEEFDEELQRQKVSIKEFLSGYWVSRMEERERNLAGPLTDAYICELQEAGVILEEETEKSSRLLPCGVEYLTNFAYDDFF